MTMFLVNLPEYQAEKSIQRKLMMRALYRDGRAARRAEVSATKASKFFDRSMKRAWLFGWRIEDKRIHKKAREIPFNWANSTWVGRGKKAKRLGLNIRQCPRYASAEQKEAWKYGWRKAHTEIHLSLMRKSINEQTKRS